MVLAAYRAARPGRTSPNCVRAHIYAVAAGDVASCAHELARLTGNVARVHHDASTSGSRLVYGGRAIGLALHQAVRYLPNLRTVVGWLSYDRLAPVREGGTLTTCCPRSRRRCRHPCGVLLACAPCRPATRWPTAIRARVSRWLPG